MGAGGDHAMERGFKRHEREEVHKRLNGAKGSGEGGCREKLKRQGTNRTEKITQR